jgi:molybdopterin converting factor small subunit
MKIDVHLFARARDLAGTPLLRVMLPVPATVGELRRRLAEMVPALSRLLEHSAIAVNNELAGDSVHLNADAEVALLPPVSGG